MIIETHYRDIPFEDIQRMPTHSRVWTASLWEKNRGKPILIRIPPDNSPVNSGCTEPRYKLVDLQNNPLHRKGSDREISVCPHIAEIGD